MNYKRNKGLDRDTDLLERYRLTYPWFGDVIHDVYKFKKKIDKISFHDYFLAKFLYSFQFLREITCEKMSLVQRPDQTIVHGLLLSSEIQKPWLHPKPNLQFDCLPYLIEILKFWS